MLGCISFGWWSSLLVKALFGGECRYGCTALSSLQAVSLSVRDTLYSAALGGILVGVSLLGMASTRKAARTKQEEDDLKRRAFAGYWKYARAGQPHASFDETEAAVHEIGGKLYVTLTSGKVRVAVFRVRNDGKLKRLVRVPLELQEDE